MDDDLVALARGARIHAVVEGRLCQQGQRVGLLLLRGNVGRVRGVGALVQGVTGGVQRLDEQGADLGGQAAPDDHGPVVGAMHVQGAALVL